MITFGSVFSGIGGFDLGFEHAGISCAWQCEADRACRSILRRHFPGPILFPNVTTLFRPPAVDVLCGGFPCQDLSVAGQRKGLAGPRSGLWWHFRRLARQLRPCIVAVENVPGLLSSVEGRDFAILLRGLVKLGYRLAWRVLDSQYDRVAQRRRRVFVVGSLGDGRCAQILFEPESLRWDSAPRRSPQEETTGALTCGIGERGYSPESASAGHYVAGTLSARAGSGGLGTDFDLDGGLVAGTLQASGKAAGSATQQDAESGLLIARCLRAQTNSSHTADSETFVVDSLARCDTAGEGKRGDYETCTLIASTLRAGAANGGSGHGARAGDKDETLIPVAFRTSPNCGAWETGERTDALTTDSDPNATVIVPTLRSNYRSNSNPGTEASMHIQTRLGVRRLTPRECERLQAFPDDWTRWTDTGKEQADRPRYKQLGNAVTVNVAEWIGRRIVAALESEVRA